ncbi:MAG: hypothetical protein ACD_58C00317G0012 [uncultured bacterium]|nr:MAG: hypothetical protein ACD_58C00317G0012 [uncultured bacterium]
MSKKHHEVVKKITNLMGFQVEVETTENESGIIINLKTEDPSLLIGKGGENLKALQHITNLVVYSQLEDGIGARVLIDVNNYLSNQKINLIRSAQNAAENVTKTNSPEVLRPMTAYERKTVHLELTKYPELMTESIGEDPNRRIVVKIKK